MSTNARIDYNKIKLVGVNIPLRDMPGSQATGVLCDIISELIPCIKNTNKLYNMLKPSEIKKNRVKFGDNFDDLILNELEVYVDMQEELKASTKFVVTGLSLDTVCTRILTDGIVATKQLVALAKEYTLACIPLENSDIKRVVGTASDAIGNLAGFLYFFLGVKDVLADFASAIKTVEENGVKVTQTVDTTIEIAGAVEQYLLKSNTYSVASVSTLYTGIRTLFNTCKPKLAVFDEYPELADEFNDLIGPIVFDYDKIAHLVTKADVLAVLKGELRPIDLVDKYEKLMESAGIDTEEFDPTAQFTTRLDF